MAPTVKLLELQSFDCQWVVTLIFDIMNTHNIQSHEFERKLFLAPFTSIKRSLVWTANF